MHPKGYSASYVHALSDGGRKNVLKNRAIFSSNYSVFLNHIGFFKKGIQDE
jgi:hypothetical protein